MNDPSLIGYIFSIVFLILLSAFFSACETSFISLGKHHFQKLLEKDEKKASKLKFWFENPNRILTTALVGNNIVNILASVLAAAVSFKYFKKVSTTLITGIMTFLILVFAEIIPKSIAKKKAEKVAIFSSIPIRFFSFILFPVIKILMFFANTFVRIFGEKIDTIMPLLTEEDVKAMISAGEEEGIIEEEEKEMIDSIFEFGDKMVKEIMTPRVNIVAVEENKSIKEILKIIASEGYSRLPVYRENIDKIVGIVYIKDIIAHQAHAEGKELKAKEIMREAYFVPETKKVIELLRELQLKKLQMAIVVDEYGGTAGLITMEDLVEEIVGEISDEYKKDVSEFHKLTDGSYLVRGSMEIEKVNDEIGIELPEGKVETIAGFILDHFGRFPGKGETFVYNGYQFKIQDADTKKIRWVRVKKIEEEKNGSGRDKESEDRKTERD